MAEPEPASPSEESLRHATELAWRDRRHARDQTWKALQIEAVIGAGLVTVDAQFKDVWATVFAAALVIVAAVFGIMISFNHRKHERRKLLHILNCEERLGLHQHNLIPLASRMAEYRRLLAGQVEKQEDLDEAMAIVEDGAVVLPSKFSFWSVIHLGRHNTALFIVRMHIAVIFFAVLMIIFRCCFGSARALPTH